MNLKFSSRNAVSLFFIFASLASLTYVTLATLNYVSFYPALSGLNPQVNAVHVQKDSSSGTVAVLTSVSVTNPTDYSGLRVYSFDVTVYFVHRQDPNTSIFRIAPLNANMRLSKPLGPRSTISSDLSVIMLPDQVLGFSMFNETYHGQIDAHVMLRLQVNTFLDPVTGRIVREGAVEIPLS